MTPIIGVPVIVCQAVLVAVGVAAGLLACWLICRGCRQNRKTDQEEMTKPQQE